MSYEKTLIEENVYDNTKLDTPHEHREKFRETIWRKNFHDRRWLFFFSPPLQRTFSFKPHTPFIRLNYF